MRKGLLCAPPRGLRSDGCEGGERDCELNVEWAGSRGGSSPLCLNIVRRQSSMPIWLTCLGAKYPVACPAKGQLANARLRILVHRRCRHPLVSKPRPKSERLPSPRGQVKTLPPTSLLSCVTLAARPGNWDPADHRGIQRLLAGALSIWLSRLDNLTLQERSLLRACRVCTPGLVSTATLPSVIRGGSVHSIINNNKNDNNDNESTTHHAPPPPTSEQPPATRTSASAASATSTYQHHQHHHHPLPPTTTQHNQHNYDHRHHHSRTRCCRCFGFAVFTAAAAVLAFAFSCWCSQEKRKQTQVPEQLQGIPHLTSSNLWNLGSCPPRLIVS